MSTRIEGYDFARALAVFGMVFVNFKIVLGSSFGNERLVTLVSLFEGRASALFVVLAGVGVSLMVNVKADPGLLYSQRIALCKRGALLILIGLVLAFIWPADILHFYGVYFLITALFIHVTDKMLWALAASFCAMFMFLLIFLDYEAGWDFSTLTYLDFWTLSGMFRHIFFNGFHPVFPWVSFVFIGMWLGRRDLKNRYVRRRILWAAGVVWAVVELLSKTMQWVALDGVSLGEDYQVLAGTEMMPPTPLYIVAAASLAIFMICVSIEITEKYSQVKAIHWMVSTGQLSLTLYIAHIFIGMGVLDGLGVIGNQSIDVAVIAAFTFCGFSILFSAYWRAWFRYGPVESIYRKIIG